MTQVVPHIGFEDKAEEAFNFYRSVFGGELSISRWNENPHCDQWSEKERNLVMHASLANGQMMLMGNDAPKAMGESVKEGNNFTVTILPDSRAEADRLFNTLTQGGNLRMPMQDMFWGDYFGALTDKFGVQWMINYHQAEK